VAVVKIRFKFEYNLVADNLTLSMFIVLI
jgi:hypothetical protein